MDTLLAPSNEFDTEPSHAVMTTDSFESMYREMLPTVYHYCAARLGRSEGEDVTAETFASAAKAYTAGRSETITPAWLMAVARNKVIDRWRRAERRQAIAHLLEPREDELTALPESRLTDPHREEVLATLDALKPRHRTLLLLHHVDGMSVGEMAEHLGCTHSSVESALARARGAFKRNYAEVRT